jgi:anion-transporting  ArsA/GET3 family ATPase
MQLHISDIPENEVVKQPANPKISYEQILSNMNMLVSNGKLHLKDRNTTNTKASTAIAKASNANASATANANANTNIPQNSYIYNKYFNDTMQQEPKIRKPKTLHEYKMMLVDDYIEKERIKRIKNKKLMIMSANNISPYSQQAQVDNKLFNLLK